MIIPSRILQTNFTSGELSPRLRGRVDLDQYQNGAALLENFMVLNAGGISRRPGSGYSGPSIRNDMPSRMIPFVVSNLTAYVVELNEYQARFWRNRGPVVDATGAPLSLVTPWPAAALRQIRFAQSNDVMYLCHSSFPTQKLSRTGAARFSLQPVIFVNGPYDTDNTGDVGAAGAPPASGTITTVDTGTTTTTGATSYNSGFDPANPTATPERG